MKNYSPNEICKLCHVSRKQLRYYEGHGLLSPVPRNDANNYRYYTQQHLNAIVAAKALRDIDMPLAEMKDIIYGRSLEAIRHSIQKQMTTSRQALETSLNRYEQSIIEYTKLMEAISALKLHSQNMGLDTQYETIDRPAQTIISLHYRTDFEDTDGLDMEYLPIVQEKARSLNAASLSISALLYLTFGHFSSENCCFDGKVHDFQIAVPVAEFGPHSQYCDHIPAFRGVSAIHIGSPKEKRLYQTYIGLLNWAKAQGYQLEDWSVEEWLISPIITNNSDLWMIKVMIPFRGVRPLPFLDHT